MISVAMNKPTANDSQRGSLQLEMETAAPINSCNNGTMDATSAASVDAAWLLSSSSIAAVRSSSSSSFNNSNRVCSSFDTDKMWSERGG